MAQLTEQRQAPLTFRDEFKLVHLRLHHHAPEDFFRSQWQSELKSCAFLIYRWILAIFFGTGLCSYLIIFFSRGTVFIYLTNWGFILCSVTSISGAIFVSIYHASTESMVNRRCMLKCYWACYWINLIFTHIIFIIYWTCIFPKKQPQNLISGIYNVWTHGLPSVFFTLDHLLVAHPARLLHFIYPFGLALLYVIFTYVYYVLGGLDRLGRSYIYEMLNHGNPLQTLKTIVMVAVLLVCCSTLQYGVYRLRVCIASKLGKLL
ncbi:hypothetical protein KR215_011471 [Drosophila sulfurigaster]|nr:hypothetical protein KR215_011471 [Drosophila sulfurigaster]